VLRLHAGGKSKRKIAASLAIGATAAGDCVRRARRAGLSWPLPENLSDETLERLLYPPPLVAAKDRRAQPDWAAIHRELRRPGVTLQLLWEEHCGIQPDGYGYSRYRELYRAWEGWLATTMRQLHVAGERMFVDYSGTTLDVMDETAGEIHVCQLFVAVLGASNFTYVEATFTQRLVDWIGSHVRALEFFGGVTATSLAGWCPRSVIDTLRASTRCACTADRTAPARAVGMPWSRAHLRYERDRHAATLDAARRLNGRGQGLMTGTCYRRSSPYGGMSAGGAG
jgi:hypothetical protein